MSKESKPKCLGSKRVDKRSKLVLAVGFTVVAVYDLEPKAQGHRFKISALWFVALLVCYSRQWNGES